MREGDAVQIANLIDRRESIPRSWTYPLAVAYLIVCGDEPEITDEAEKITRARELLKESNQ